MTGDERWLQLADLRLAAIEWGRADAPPVLALHGWLDNAASFARLAPLLPELHVIALDLPGHGRSGHRPAGWSHHFVDWVPLVLEAAAVIGWSRYSIFGHSMGAGIASLVPAVAPDVIDRLVLLEGVGPMSGPPEEAPDQLAKAIRSETAVTGSEARKFSNLEAAIGARRKGSDLDRDAARLLVERGTEQVGEGIRFTHDPRLRSPSRLRLSETQVLAFLERIPCPVLAIRASDGWPFPEDLLAGRLSAIPDLRTATVEGGHHVHLTDPDRVAPLVRDFLCLATNPDE